MGDATAIIIGAGPAGLATAAALRHHNITYLHFDLHHEPGGSWAADHPHRYPATQRLQTGHTGGFTGHTFTTTDTLPTTNAVREHLTNYTHHHQLHHNIHLSHTITDVTRTTAGWTITGHHHNTPITATATNLIIAVGHRSAPRIPAWCPPHTACFPHDLTHHTHHPLLVAHSNAITTHEPLTNHHVAFAGTHEHTLDILHLDTRHTYTAELSTDPWPPLLPDTIAGTPSLTHLARAATLPHLARTMAYRALSATTTQRATRYGITPTPLGLGARQPLLATRLLEALASGRATLGQRPTSIDGPHVFGADGQRIAATAVICSTGYAATPSLVKHLLPHHARLHLVADTFATRHPGLFVVGHYADADGSFKHYETSAHMIASYLSETSATRRATWRRIIHKEVDFVASTPCAATPWLPGTARHMWPHIEELLNR